jgi:hypothetical protein
VIDGGAHDAILRRRWRREHLSDESRLIGITGFHEMPLIPYPMGIAFAAVGCLQVVGLADQQRRGRLLVPRAPAELFQARGRTAVIVLQPNPPQDLKRRDGVEARWILREHYPVGEIVPAPRAGLSVSGRTC